MPDMNGYEFMKKLRQIKTEVKVTLTTAFKNSDVPIIDHGL
jgi:CheY-like chemotaxis protein